jgi:hypothetical protein
MSTRTTSYPTMKYEDEVPLHLNHRLDHPGLSLVQRANSVTTSLSGARCVIQGEVSIRLDSIWEVSLIPPSVWTPSTDNLTQQFGLLRRQAMQVPQLR